MTWLELPVEHPYGLQTLPYGVFSTHADRSDRRVGVRVGDLVLDVSAVAGLDGDAGDGHDLASAWRQPSLNAFLELGPLAWGAARNRLSTWLSEAAYEPTVSPHLLPLTDVSLHLPFEVADYVDFYASQHHASNVGQIFRPDSPGLPPNWKHLPIGYHGRAGTVVVSGTDVLRPRGQRRPGEDGRPPFGPSRSLDLECEVGFVVGSRTALGQSVSTEDAARHVFGVVLVNDWSARDIQAWEYVPLGPFLGKSFATSISAWVVPSIAFEEARVPLPSQDPEPLPYLRKHDDQPLWGLDVHLEVDINGTVVSRPEFRDMYWSVEQMLAHLTVNGASLRPGDLFASGTVSGPEPGQRGCLLELTWNGQQPLTLDDGSTRGFLEDGDVVTLRGWAPGPGGKRVALGEVTGRIVPARD